jgi:hypothetical protein
MAASDSVGRHADHLLAAHADRAAPVLDEAHDRPQERRLARPVRAEERDRLTGDTIVAHFDTAASQLRDTTSKPKITLLVSTGHATSLQHLPPRDTTLRTPAIVYVTGKQITVRFDSGAVQRVEVEDEDLAAGLYLEPDSARAKKKGAASQPSPAKTPEPTPAPSPAPASVVPLPSAAPPKKP